MTKTSGLVKEVRKITEMLGRVRFEEPADASVQGIVVDCSGLATTEMEPTRWLVEYDSTTGLWEHIPSGTSGHLGEVIWSIVACYRFPVDENETGSQLSFDDEEK